MPSQGQSQERLPDRERPGTLGEDTGPWGLTLPVSMESQNLGQNSRSPLMGHGGGRAADGAQG